MREPSSDTVVAEPLNKLEYLTFLVIGVSYLWPWNSFLSAIPYFALRLEGHAVLQESVSSSLMLISTVTSTAIFIYLVGRQKDANYTARIGYGELIIAAAFLVLALSCLVFTASSPVAYYVFILITMLVSTFGTSYAQNGSFAIVNLFGPIYAQAIMVGQAVAGILPPIVSMISAISAVAASKRLQALGQAVPESKTSLPSFFSFLVSSFIALLALFLFYLLIKQEPTKLAGETSILPLPSAFHTEHGYNMISDHADLEAESDIVESPSVSEGTLSVSEYSTKPDTISSPLEMFKKLKAPAISVFLVFSASLAFPVFLQAVLPVHNSETSILFTQEVFVPFALFIWNLGDLVGRLVCGKDAWVIKNDKVMIIYALARFAFIPLYFMCNINGRGGWIHSDSVYLAIHFFNGLTNGHLGTSVMMESGTYVENHEKEQAGSFMTMMLSIGLTAGSLFSFVLVACVHRA